MINGRQLQRPDGALWHVYEQENARILMTSQGKELYSGNPDLEREVRLYLRKSLGHASLGDTPGVRSYFEGDTNGHVYTLDSVKYGNDLLVKETNGHSMEKALERLDSIKSIITKRQLEGRLPRWIDVPDHYGVITSDGLPSQYILMQGIDSGINVRDIIDFDNLNGKEKLGVESIMGKITATVISEVQQGYEETEDKLMNAIAEETYQNPTKLLSDWHPGNLLVEKLPEPIDSSNYKFWVIDQ